MNNDYDILDRPLTQQETNYIAKHIDTKKKQKFVAFCLTKKGKMTNKCNEVRKEFRKIVKPNKPSVVSKSKNCGNGKIVNPQSGKCIAKTGTVYKKLVKNGVLKNNNNNNNNNNFVKRPSELFVLTAMKKFNPKLNRNINLKNYESNYNNIPSLITNISEMSERRKNNIIKDRKLIPGDIVYVGTGYTSRPHYGFAIIEKMGVLDTAFGSDDLDRYMKGNANERKEIIDSLKSYFDMKFDSVFKKILKFNKYLSSY